MLLIKKLQKLIPTNLLGQLKVFISTVVAKVSGNISNTVIPMRRGLTQGGTSSPPLFRIFINDLPDELRKTTREKFPNFILEDPSLLVTDDVIALSATLDEMQEIANTCYKWGATNGLKWNPLKLQLLKMLLKISNAHNQATNPTGTQTNEQVVQQVAVPPVEATTKITLNGTVVRSSEEADYLVLLINTRRGFICKDTSELLTKGKGSVTLISKNKWFSLQVQPKHIANIYDTHFRSSLMYGSKLLTLKERQPLIEGYNKLITLLFK